MLLTKKPLLPSRVRLRKTLPASHRFLERLMDWKAMVYGANMSLLLLTVRREAIVSLARGSPLGRSVFQEIKAPPDCLWKEETFALEGVVALAIPKWGLVIKREGFEEEFNRERTSQLPSPPSLASSSVLCQLKSSSLERTPLKETK